MKSFFSIGSLNLLLAVIAYGPVPVALATDAKLPTAYWIFGALLLPLLVLNLPAWVPPLLGSRIWGPGAVIVLFYWTGMLGWERDHLNPVAEMLVAAIVILGGFTLWHKPTSNEEEDRDR